MEQNRSFAPSCAHALPAWAEPMNACLPRIRRWRVPPNWSGADWHDELFSVATLAAIEAAGAFDSARGTPFDSFVRSRVLARTLTYYRQEWAYAARRVDGVSLPEDQETLHADLNPFASGAASRAAAEAVREALALLPEQSRWLMQELHVHERTEIDIGHQLGISHQAVSKRKKAALRELRQRLAQSAVEVRGQQPNCR
jgi:RNA polymerase sigma factor (sigma-70 family)